MEHAIPSNPTAMDLDADGTMDRLYAIDVMGRIFRVDFNSTEGTNTNKHYVPTGRLYANLNPTDGDHRFYNAVNTAVSQVGAEYRIHLNVGSGRRPNPLNRTTSDQFYSVVDTHVFDATLPSTDDAPVITASDLVNATTGTGNVEHDSKGWYFDLTDTGEKVLSKASTRGGYVFFTTYVPPVPPAQGTQSCEPPLGTAYLYVVAQSNSAALDTNRRITLQSSGIPPAPTFLTLEKDGNQISDPDNPYVSQDSKTILLVGTDKPELNSADAQQTLTDALNRTAEKIYWKQN
jgi:type IV pilus assembly protein PilY1